MTNNTNQDQIVHLQNLYFNIYDSNPTDVRMMPPSGSYREYYRMTDENRSIIGVFNKDRKENIAFLYYSKHFKSLGLNVPEILAEDLDNHVYLQQDLGDITLFSYLSNNGAEYNENLKNIYKNVLEHLIDFQIKGIDGLDLTKSYPRAAFDKQSMLWDCSYFKYYFLKLAKIPFDEQLLENDFQTFTEYLLTEDCNYFLYRDFQSRNIMLHNDNPFFIDYQGGRKGALQYDVASLLYDAKADIPQEVRHDLLTHYIQKLNEKLPIDEQKFRTMFSGYAMIRLMQAMGAYGFRGFYERKEHFLQSIPFAVRDMAYLIPTIDRNIQIPELQRVWTSLIESIELKKINSSRLKLNVRSFSYRKGIPPDTSGHGGGFVFDCRLLHNPGRYEKYVNLTGKDQEVKDFFKEQSDIKEFLHLCKQLVSKSVKTYLKRRFSHLTVFFGCTGGQHRSVYCAEQLTEFLKVQFPEVDIQLFHTEQDNNNLAK